MHVGVSERLLEMLISSRVMLVYLRNMLVYSEHFVRDLVCIRRSCETDEKGCNGNDTKKKFFNFNEEKKLRCRYKLNFYTKKSTKTAINCISFYIKL